MTEQQIADLIDLYVEDELPETLRETVETYLAAHEDTAQDVYSLQQTAARLKAAPGEHPDSWFVERVLDGLLREDAGAEKAPLTPNFGEAGR